MIAVTLEIFTPYNCKGFLLCWSIDAFSFTLSLNEKLPFSEGFNYYDESFNYFYDIIASAVNCEMGFFSIIKGKKSKI